GSTRGPFVPPGVWLDGFAVGADSGRAASGHGGRRRAICHAAGAAALALPRRGGISSGVARESCLSSRAGCFEKRTKTALLRRRERIRAEKSNRGIANDWNGGGSAIFSGGGRRASGADLRVLPSRAAACRECGPHAKSRLRFWCRGN